MSDLLSFLRKKVTTKLPVSSEGETSGPTVVMLLENINPDQLVKLVAEAKSPVLYFVITNLIDSTFRKDLDFAIRAAGEFDENPKLAFMVVKDKGIVPTRKSFFTDCLPDLTAWTPIDLFEQLRHLAQQRGYEFKMASEEVYDLMRCAELFIDRNYDACIRQGLPALESAPNAVVALVTLISLQRRNQSDKVMQVVEQLRPALVADPWLATLVQLTLGNLELREVLAKADNNQRLYQSYFYAGARFNTLARIDLARDCFAKCRAMGLDCIEKCFVDLELDEPPTR
jgi:hypothetical protein